MEVFETNLKNKNRKWGENFKKKIMSELISEFQEKAHFGNNWGVFFDAFGDKIWKIRTENEVRILRKK